MEVESNQMRWNWGLVVLIPYWIALFYGTHKPSFGPSPVDTYDKPLHAGAYFGLAFLLCCAQGFRGPVQKGHLKTLVLVSAYGVLDELLQHFVTGRHPEFADWLADTIGATFGIAAYRIVERTLTWAAVDGE